MPETAAYNLHLAISLITALGQWELEQGQALVSLKQLKQLASEDVQLVSDAVLEHCVLSLSSPREIRFGVKKSAYLGLILKAARPQLYVAQRSTLTPRII
ncbi:hypothetical protein [Pseudomonas sp. NPDC089741]|uniref:hypothetical protein n=1 Tax=Pseudomonas sp. NPDC089741 TaxID=3364470 RepID=UPI0038045153